METKTIKEFCYLLKISKSTYYRRIKPENKCYDPTFPKSIAIGGKKYILQKHIDVFFNQFL